MIYANWVVLWWVVGWFVFLFYMTQPTPDKDHPLFIAFVSFVLISAPAMSGLFAFLQIIKANFS